MEEFFILFQGKARETFFISFQQIGQKKRKKWVILKAFFYMAKFSGKWIAIQCATTVTVLALATLGDMMQIGPTVTFVISLRVAKASARTVVAQCIACHFM
jgi:hypothetical protein